MEKTNIYPASVSCWAGDSLDSLSLLGQLDLVDDQNLGSSLTRVYALNLNRLKAAESNRQLRTQLNQSFKVIEFRMRRPNLASLADIFEGSQKAAEGSYYTVSFVSINGYQEPTSPPSFVETHLKLLSLLSQSTFKATLDALTEMSFFKKRFPETVEAFSKWISVPAYAKLISKLLTTISENSKELGNQILDSFFRQKKRDVLTARLLGELITRNIRLAGERISKFYHFLLESLSAVNATNCHDYEHYFEVFVQALEVSARNIHRLAL